MIFSSLSGPLFVITSEEGIQENRRPESWMPDEVRHDKQEPVLISPNHGAIAVNE